MLLHDVRPLVDQAMRDYGGSSNRAAQRMARGSKANQANIDDEEDEEDGPANTWPLGEILSARHDQLHSKIFNS